MSTLVLAFQSRFQAKALPPQQAFRLAHQLRLPFDGVGRLALIVGGFVARAVRRRPSGIVYFGKRRQFFAIGTTVGRVAR